MMMKIVVQLQYTGDKGKKKALAAVSSMTGIVSISIDGNDKKLTVVGEIDVVDVVLSLRKVCRAHVISAGKLEEKKKEEKKDDKKEEKKDDKKDDKKKKEEANKDGKKKEKTDEEKMNDHMRAMMESYRHYNPHLTDYYRVQSMEENPNACVIC